MSGRNLSESHVRPSPLDLDKDAEPVPVEQEANEEDRSADVSALTDEEEERNNLRSEKLKSEAQKRAEMDKKTQEKLNKILLSSSTKRNLWLIKSIEVSEALDVFWDAIPKNEKETADYDGVEKCFMLICRLMLPGLKQENLEMFTQDLLRASKMRETSHFTQDEFFEALLSLADLFTECLDIQTATTFLEFAINRVTQKVIVKATGERERVQGTLAVNFYNTQNLNKSLKDELNSPQQPENVIYVKEHYQMTPIETGIEDSVITNLRELDSILPLGTAVNEVINDQINDRTPKENYEISNSHELDASLSKAETLFYIGFIIEDTDGKAIRLNPALFSPYFFEKLQDKSGNTIFVNQRSIYDNAASIDKVYEMTKRWNDKLVVPKPSEQEIWDKPIEDIFNVLVQGKFRFNKKDNEAEAKDLDFKTSDTFPTIHSEKFAMFRTREPDLPKDTLNPYAEDLITYAKERPFHILVHGKPKIGKSKFCKTLAQKLDLELIDIDVFVQNFLKRVQEGEENIQNDDEGNPIEFLKPFERQAITAIRRGERISHENLLAIINDEISKLRVEHKGCVFEVPCFDNPTKQMNYLQLIQDGKMHINNQKPVFNVVIELYVKDDQLLNRTRQIRENANPANFITISEAEQKTPVEKVKKEGDDDDDDDADIDPDDPKIIKEENLYRRINESDVVVWKGLINYKETVRPIVEKLEGSVHHLNNIFVDYDTLTVAQAVDTIYAKLFPRSKFLRPISASIEDAGEEDYASLTKANLKTDEGELMRRWSLFYKHDPVALFNKKVQKGLSQFSCEYAGRIFCFANEQNKALFIKDPKPYLLEVPKLPKQFNVSIVGMTNTGKKLYAQKIAEKYGLEIVDLPALILKKYEEQSKWEQHIPNNPEGGSVHFSKNEFAELKKGTGFDTRLALPLLLHDKGIHLYKRPPPPKDPAELEEEERLRKEEEERKAEEAKKKKKLTAKKDEKKEEAPPKEPSVPVLEDFNLTDLVPKPDEKGVVPELQGYIFIDFPISEAQINTMKEMNINLDRLIILKEPDTTEAGEPEEPGNVITKRPNFFEKTTFADEQAYLEAASNAIKAGGIEEDRITEIFSGNIEQTFMKIRQFIDPFELRIDDDSTALPVEEGDFSEKILFGEYGNYCPVTAVDNNWLILGKPELEVQVRGYRYRFYNEDCKKKFEENIEKYVAPPESPPVPPEPRIFMTGCSGSGLHTNIERLQAKLRIPIVNFRSEFKNVTEHMKMQRKEERRRLKGFTLTAPEDGAPIEDIKDEPDPEIENDPDDFDVTKSEQQITNLILGKLGAAIINCRMDPPPKPDPVLIDEPEQDEEEELDENGEPKVKEEPPAKEDEPPEEILKQPFVELLTETKRLPELIIILTVSEVEMLKRRFNKKKIQDIYDHKLGIIARKKEKARAKRLKEMDKERRQKKEEALAEGGNADEIDLDAPLEIDPDQLDGIYQAAGVPEEPDLAKMLEEEKEKLVNQLKEETDKLETLASSLTDLNVKVLKFEANKDFEKVFKKITEEVRQILDDRESLYERQRVVKVTETETLPTDKVLDWVLKSYTTKESRFGRCNPIVPNRAIQTINYPIVYLNRVYYPSSEEERELLLRNPLKCLSKDPVAPKDIPLRPKIILIGKYKSGKTTVAKKACELLGLVHITIPEVQELFCKNKFYGKGKQLFEILASGQVPDDELIVELLNLRLQFSDVTEKGYILEGFPQTKKQAILMYKNKILPDFVVGQSSEDFVIKTRAKNGTGLDSFEYDQEIMDIRLNAQSKELLAVENLYTYNFGNIRRLTKESTDSRVIELTSLIEEYIRGRQAAAVGINLEAPFDASRLSIKKSTVMGNLCPALTFSCVSLKKFGIIEQMFLRSDPLVYYRERFFLLKDQDQVKYFSQHPETFEDATIEAQKVARHPTLREVYEKQVELRQYCPVDLMVKKLVKGKRHLSLIAFNKLYCFSSVRAMRIFFKNPSAFLAAKLPEKIRVTPLPNNLKTELAKDGKERGDLQTYINNELSKLIVKALNQASKFRLKYPTISVHSTAIKLVALCLKASNPNQSEETRLRFKDKMKAFIADCLLPQQIQDEYLRREQAKQEGESVEDWNHFNEEHFLRLAEEFHELMKKVKLRNPEDYFIQFIR